MKTTDLLLHPVRMRIVQAFLGDRELTTAELRSELPGVSPATLYRQVAALLEGGALEVTGERKVRGAVERTYRLHATRVAELGADTTSMTVDEHRRAFTAFMAARLDDFERYLGKRADDTAGPDFAADRVGYRFTGLHLSDEETDELIAALQQAVRPFAERPAAPGRRRRILSTILMPADEA